MSFMSPETRARINEYATKLSVPPQEIEATYQKHINALKQLYPGKDASFYDNRARFLLYREIKEQLRSPAITFEGVVLGYSSIRDITEPQRRLAMETFRENPERAMREGLTDANGTPLDNRPTLPTGRPNPFYGHPIQSVPIRQSVGVGKIPTETDFKLFVLTQLLDQAKTLPPIGKPVRFRALIRGKGDMYELNTSRITAYQEHPIPFFKDLHPIDLLRNAPPIFKLQRIADIANWHDANKDNRNRVCIVEGDVITIRREPTAFGNYIVVIEDESTRGLETEGLTVWVHEDIKQMLDFGAGSAVTLIGRTVMGPGWNPDTRRLDPSIQRVMVNAFGIYADPQLRIPMNEEEIYGTEVD